MVSSAYTRFYYLLNNKEKVSKFSLSGLISSLVISGYGYGSLIWIPMETAFVNPDNVDPGEGGYYDNQDLLDR